MKIAQYFTVGAFLALLIYSGGAFVTLDLSWVLAAEPKERGAATVIWLFGVFCAAMFIEIRARNGD